MGEERRSSRRTDTREKSVDSLKPVCGTGFRANQGLVEKGNNFESQIKEDCQVAMSFCMVMHPTVKDRVLLEMVMIQKQKKTLQCGMRFFRTG